MIDWEIVFDLGCAVIGGLAILAAIYAVACVLVRWSDRWGVRRCPHCGKAGE